MHKLQLFITVVIFLQCIAGAKAYEVEESQFFDGNWVVPADNITIGKNCTVGTNANLFVYGTLELTNCTFTLNSTFGKILVAENGSLDIVNSTIISINQSQVILKGYARIENCRVENLELQIYSNTFNITNVTITGSERYGVVIKNCSPRLQNNTIRANSKGGICSISASANILENRIINNGIGFVAMGSNDTVVGNNISNNKGHGVTLINSSKVKLENNSILNNNNAGIFLNSSRGTIKNNTIGNNNWGIELLDSKLKRENNSYSGNREGTLVQKWSLRINIVNGNNEYVENVGLDITNVKGNKFWGGVINGSITIVLPEYEIINNTRVNHSPYSLHYKKNNLSNNKIVRLNRSINLTLKLLADVLIKDIVVPSRTSPGENTTIEVALYNPYSIKISVRLNVSIDSVPLYDFTLMFAGNTTKNLSLTWCSTEGRHKLKVLVDQNDLVEEQNENNNYKFRTIEVSKSISTAPKQEHFQYALLTLVLLLLLGAVIFLTAKKK